MQISKETQTILKSLATVNPNIYIQEGNMLMSRSPQRNIAAEIEVPDTFPINFSIYDLSEFLGALSMFDSPEVEFTEKYADITEGAAKLRYYAADYNVIKDNAHITPLKFPPTDYEFELPANVLAAALRTAGVIKSADISFIGNGTDITLCVTDLKNVTSNNFTIKLTDSPDVFQANLKVENLKLIPGDYTVSISSKRVSRFKSTKSNYVVYIALETTSEMN